MYVQNKSIKSIQCKVNLYFSHLKITIFFAIFIHERNFVAYTEVLSFFNQLKQENLFTFINEILK